MKWQYWYFATYYNKWGLIKIAGHEKINRDVTKDLYLSKNGMWLNPAVYNRVDRYIRDYNSPREAIQQLRKIGIKDKVKKW